MNHWLPKGIYVDVLGTYHGSSGRKCAIHDVCGSQLAAGSILVTRIVRQYYKGAPKIGIAVFTHSLEDKKDGCRVGFLPSHLMSEVGHEAFVNKIFRVVEVYSEGSEKYDRSIVYRTEGIVRAEMLVEIHPKDRLRKRPADPGTPDKVGHKDMNENDTQKKLGRDDLDQYSFFSPTK